MPRKVGVGDQHVFHVGLTERQPKLEDMFGVAADQGHFPPGKFRTDDQPVQPVVFGLTRKHCHEAFFEPIGHGIDVDGVTAFVTQVEILNPEGLARLQFRFVRMFGMYLGAHALENRQGVGEH